MPPIRTIELVEQHRVHISKFDDDHRQLISLFNELDDAVQHGKARTTLRMVLLGLGNYAQKHFAAEEELMDETAYEAYDAHVAEHREFAAKVHDFTRAYEIGDTGVSLEVVSYLRSWLEHHLSVTDRALGVYLSSDKIH